MTLIVYMISSTLIRSDKRIPFLGKNPTKKKLRRFSFAMAVLMQSYPWIYIVGDIDGQVVDSNGAPLEGVLVTSLWNTIYVFRTYGIEAVYGHEAGALEVIETITDKDGKYHIPGFWKFRPFFEEIHGGYVDAFKKGLYHDGQLSSYNKDKKSNILGLYYEARANDSVFVMREIKNRQEKSFNSEGLSRFIHAAQLLHNHCYWTKIPNTFIYLVSPKHSNVKRHKVILGYKNEYEFASCGVKDYFFKDYIK
ncbi:MAG: hypothetical protein GQ546_00785 [Gammaproteobacteria bacterium]|nr:hypothetical protein [Gammaproteobacteria bacterium]